MNRNSKLKLAILSASGIFLLSAILYFVVPSKSALSGEKAKAKAEAMILKLKEDGLPTDFDSLNQLYISQTAPEDSAKWKEALAYLSSQKFILTSQHTFPFRNASPPYEEYLPSQKQILSDNALLVSTISEMANKRKAVRFELGYRTPPPTLKEVRSDFIYRAAAYNNYMTGARANQLHDVQWQFKQVIALLACGMHVGIAENDSATVKDSLAAQINLLSLTQGEELLDTHLRNCDLQNCVLNNVKMALEANVLAQDDLELLLSQLQSLPSHVSHWPQIIQSERAWLLPYLTGQVSLPLGYDEGELESRSITLDGGSLLDFLWYSERYEHIDWKNWATAKVQLDECEKDLPENVSQFNFEDQFWIQSFMRWNKLAELLARSDSERNEAIIASSLQLYLRKKKAFPADLQQLSDIGVNATSFKSIADAPFGYENRNDVAYLWGPTQDASYRLFFATSQVPDIVIKSHLEPIILNDLVWVLPNK